MQSHVSPLPVVHSLTPRAHISCIPTAGPLAEISACRDPLQAQVYGSSAQNAIDSTSATPDDHWTHLTLRTREEDCSLCLFINGYESSCVAGCGDITPYSDADDLTMGYAGFHTYYAGEAKSAAIFDVPLLENQIATWAGQDYYEVSDLVYIDESMSYEAAAQYCRSNQRELVGWLLRPTAHALLAYACLSVFLTVCLPPLPLASSPRATLSPTNTGDSLLGVTGGVHAPVDGQQQGVDRVH